MEQKRILIVDDETEVTTFFTYFLRRKNCEVVVANTGKDVQWLLQNDSRGFQAALVDLKLPDADGLELLRKIKAVFPACEVLIMTGYSTIKSAVTAMQWGPKTIWKSRSTIWTVWNTSLILSSLLRRTKKMTYPKKPRNMVSCIQQKAR